MNLLLLVLVLPVRAFLITLTGCQVYYKQVTEEVFCVEQTRDIVMDIQSVAHYQVMIPVYYAICFFVGMTLMPYSPFEILHLSAAFVFLGTCYTAVKNLIFPMEVLLFSLSAACLVAATATGYVGYSVVYTGSLLLAVFLENMFTSIGFMLLAFVNLMWVVCIGLAASCITHISIDYRFGLVAVFFLGSASAIALALRFFDYWFRAEPNESEWRP